MEVGWKIGLFGVCDWLSDDVARVDELWRVERRFVFEGGVPEDHFGW